MKIVIHDGEYTDEEASNFEKILNKKEVIDWFKDYEIVLNNNFEILSDIEYDREGEKLSVNFEIKQDLYKQDTEIMFSEKIEEEEILKLLDIENFENEECCYFNCEY